MIYQNNHTPVVLSIIILVGAVTMGVLLTDTEVFNPTRAIGAAHASETSSALVAESTRIMLGATQTPMALQGQLGVKQTLAATNATVVSQTLVAQRTAIPVAQTATQAAVISGINVAQGLATQTAIAVDSNNRLLQAQATQTAILAQQTLIANNANATATRVAIGIQGEIDKREFDQTTETMNRILVSTASIVVIVGILYCLIMVARVKHSEAIANQLREHRRMLEVEAALQSRQAQKNPESKVISLYRSDPAMNHAEQSGSMKDTVSRVA